MSQSKVRIFRALFTGVVLILLVVFFTKNHESLRSLQYLKTPDLLIAVALVLMGLVFSAEQVRRCFVRGPSLEIGPWRWFQYYVCGRLANNILSALGTLYRAAQLRLVHSISISDYFAATSLSSYISLSLMLIASFVVAVLVMEWQVLYSLVVGIFGTTFLILSLIAIPIVVGRAFPNTTYSHLVIQKSISFASAVHRSFIEAGRAKGTLLVVFIYAAAGLAANVGLFYIVGIALFPNFSLVEAIFFALISKLSTLVSFTPGNIGIREAAFEAFARLGEAGALTGSGAVFSLTLRALGLLVVIPLGSIFLIREGTEKAD